MNKKFDTKALFEKYGFKDFDNPMFYNVCEVITNNIERIIREYPRYTSDDKYCIFPIGHPNERNGGFVMKRVLLRNSLDWLKMIDVYVKIDRNMEKYDSFCLYDNGLYNPHTDSISKYELVVSQEKHITKQNFPFIMTKDYVSLASIGFVVNSRNSITHEEMIYVVMHEIGHIYDVFSGKVSFTYLNRDLITKSYSYPNALTPNECIEINKITTRKYSVSELKALCSKISVDVICGVVCSCIYSINRSELKQRLKNFLYDLKSVSADKLNVGNSVHNGFENKLISVSETYSFYHNVACVFRTFVDYVPKEKKIEFAEKYIKGYFSRPVSSVDVYTDEYRNNDAYTVADPWPYGMKFSVNGRYDEKSFDKMFNFFINRIEKVFLSRACEIADEVNFSLNQYGSMFEKLYRTPKITPDNAKYIIF